ncbi:unnamed protein product [Discula destructiva]
MLFRHTRAVRAVGLRTRQFFTPTSALSTSCLVARAFSQPATTIRTQKRLNSSLAPDSTPEAASSTQTAPKDISNIPTLKPPFQFEDLSLDEQKAYYVYGPNYLEHLDPTSRKRAIQRAEKRKVIAEEAARKVGSDWYAVMKFFDKQQRVRSTAFWTQITKRKAALAELVNYPEDMPKLEKRDLAQRKTAGDLAIKAEIKQYHEKEIHLKANWMELKEYAEKVRNQQTS